MCQASGLPAGAPPMVWSEIGLWLQPERYLFKNVCKSNGKAWILPLAGPPACRLGDDPGGGISLRFLMKTLIKGANY